MFTQGGILSCSVCGGSFRHPDNWNKEFKEWIMTSSQLDMQSCLCPKCSRSLRRKWGNFSYVPREFDEEEPSSSDSSSPSVY